MSQFDELPSPLKKVLRASGHEASSPYTRRIFTNRDLDFDKIDVVGFDMDYTLARYRQSELDQISIEATLDKLLEAGYPKRDSFDSRDLRASTIRGLVVDTRLGNLLKMDRHGYVGRVHHGRDELSKAQRQRIYRNKRVLRERGRFTYVDTLFSLPEVHVYASLVTMLDERPELWSERESTELRANLQRRAQRPSTPRTRTIRSSRRSKTTRHASSSRTPSSRPTLHKLRSAGKKLFLLTNSYAPYSNAVMKLPARRETAQLRELAELLRLDDRGSQEARLL